MSKINREHLIEDLLDTESNDFEGVVISALFDKYKTEVPVVCDDGGRGSTLPMEVIDEDNFIEAMKEFLTVYMVNFIKSARGVK